MISVVYKERGLGAVWFRSANCDVNGIKTSAIHCSVKDTARHFVLLDALMASMMAGKQIAAAGMEGGRSSIRLDPFTA